MAGQHTYHVVTDAKMKVFGLAPLPRARHGFLPPQLKTNKQNIFLQPPDFQTFLRHC